MPSVKSPKGKHRPQACGHSNDGMNQATGNPLLVASA